MRKTMGTFWMVGTLALPLLGCGGTSAQEGSVTEVATSVVSGSINSNGASFTQNMRAPKASPVRRIINELSPIGSAWAASWTCTGGSLSPSFHGPGVIYAWTPVSCQVAWGNGKTASSEWSGPFDLNYGTSCDSTHAWIGLQTANCSVTRTTGSEAVTRTITGPNGGTYAISHDTNGAGSGWDSSVSPAPNNGGVVLTCGSSGCLQGKTLVINGSHLTGTVKPAGSQTPEKIWDHTVSTGAAGLTITGEGTNRTVSGSVTVEHNLAKYTATATFNNVTYGEAGCCFPTSGSVSATFSSGANQGKTETLTFSNVCGDATLTTASGQTVSLTLQHCL